MSPPAFHLLRLQSTQMYVHLRGDRVEKKLKARQTTIIKTETETNPTSFSTKTTSYTTTTCPGENDRARGSQLSANLFRVVTSSTITTGSTTKTVPITETKTTVLISVKTFPVTPVITTKITELITYTTTTCPGTPSLQLKEIVNLIRWIV